MPPIVSKHRRRSFTSLSLWHELQLIPLIWIESPSTRRQQVGCIKRSNAPFVLCACVKFVIVFHAQLSSAPHSWRRLFFHRQSSWPKDLAAHGQNPCIAHSLWLCANASPVRYDRDLRFTGAFALHLAATDRRCGLFDALTAYQIAVFEIIADINWYAKRPPQGRTRHMATSFLGTLYSRWWRSRPAYWLYPLEPGETWVGQ